MIRVLIGTADRSLNSAFERTVRDLCFERAEVEIVRMCRLGDFVRQGCFPGFSVIIVDSGELLPDLSPRATPVTLDKICCGIQAIRYHHSTPVLAVVTNVEDEMALLDAGVNSVFCRPLNDNNLRTELEKVLSLGTQVQRRGLQWSLWGALGAGFMKPTNN